jgi:hypothetical protein
MGIELIDTIPIKKTSLLVPLSLMPIEMRIYEDPAGETEMYLAMHGGTGKLIAAFDETVPPDRYRELTSFFWKGIEAGRDIAYAQIIADLQQKLPF